MINLRTIEERDFNDAEKLIKEAFTKTEHGYENEAELVKKIRHDVNYNVNFELVVEKDGYLVGHGLLSEVTLKTESTELIGLCLAPLCVAPDEQRTGVGSAILSELEQRAIEKQYPFISILGHPKYYTKFSYEPTTKFNISAPFPVPEEAYLIKELQPNALDGWSGTIHYSEAFN